MTAKSNLLIYSVLVSATVIFLVIEHLTHIEFMFHLAAIPIEVLVAVFLVEMYLTDRQQKERRHQLMYIKSWMFRLEMRNLFISNITALKSPAITIAKIKEASLSELQEMRKNAEIVEYVSLQAMEPVILEYMNAQDVWKSFMNIALEYRFDDIFQNMVDILHFVSDVKTFKEYHPNELFINEATKHEGLIRRVMSVLGDGIRKYLDYAIELKAKEPELFEEVISDYELSVHLSRRHQHTI
jgi:hypothetical protein